MKFCILLAVAVYVAYSKADKNVKTWGDLRLSDLVALAKQISQEKEIDTDGLQERTLSHGWHKSGSDESSSEDSDGWGSDEWDSDEWDSSSASKRDEGALYVWPTRQENAEEKQAIMGESIGDEGKALRRILNELIESRTYGRRPKPGQQVSPKPKPSTTTRKGLLKMKKEYDMESRAYGKPRPKPDPNMSTTTTEATTTTVATTTTTEQPECPGDEVMQDSGCRETCEKSLGCGTGRQCFCPEGRPKSLGGGKCGKVEDCKKCQGDEVYRWSGCGQTCDFKSLGCSIGGVCVCPDDKKYSLGDGKCVAWEECPERKYEKTKKASTDERDEFMKILKEILHT